MKYEELQRVYSRKKYYWGKKPNQFAKTVLNYTSNNNGLKLMDIGAGEGRDSVFFADKGFEVYAMDIAPNGLEKAEQLAEKMGVKISTLKADVNTFEIIEPMDILYSIGTLQYIRPENRRKQFIQFQKRTKPGGLNAFFVFTNHPDLPMAPDWGENEYFYKREELQSYYSSWNLLFSEELIFEDDSSGKPHKHAARKIIARKPCK